MEKGESIKIGILIILCLFTAKVSGGETVTNGKGSDLLCFPTDYIPADTDHVHSYTIVEPAMRLCCSLSV